ncbi:DNA damage-regulated autophagy modulator protein 1-like [Rhinoderma darwinii]|uniref:DNA damage-regulated autophagy modulator protein 1-like n=1 Tax=Rhinoderma darwinii TaxID=43563 RepID=UPI003F66DDD2
MEINGLGFFSILLAFWCVAWLSASYTLTVINNHATPLMYISEAGNYFPENILFIIGFEGMAIASLGLMFLHYKFIMLHAEAFGAHQALIQKILLAIGWSSCGNIVVMAVFSTDAFPITHRLSSFIAFGLGGIYNLWQSILLYKVPGSRRVISHFRTASCIMALTLVVSYIGSRVSVYTHLCAGDECLKISEMTAKIIEWSTLVLILVNVLSYYQNMQSLSITITWKSFTISKRENDQDSGV